MGLPHYHSIRCSVHQRYETRACMQRGPIPDPAWSSARRASSAVTACSCGTARIWMRQWRTPAGSASTAGAPHAGDLSLDLTLQHAYALALYAGFGVSNLARLCCIPPPSQSRSKCAPGHPTSISLCLHQCGLLFTRRPDSGHGRYQLHNGEAYAHRGTA